LNGEYPYGTKGNNNIESKKHILFSLEKTKGKGSNVCMSFVHPEIEYSLPI